MQSETIQNEQIVSSPEFSGKVFLTRTCHCAFAVYANVPVSDERGRYCSACGHYEFRDNVVVQ